MSEIAKHWIDGEWTGSGTVSESVSFPSRSGSDLEHDGQCSGAADTAPERSSHLNHRVIGIFGPMSEGAHQGAEKPPPVNWLTAAELDSWLSVVRLISWLPWSIDQQLRRDSNLGMVEYQVMARLSQSPERTLRMSLLADLANASLSRLSHLVKRLEERGLVRREPDPRTGGSPTPS